MASINENKQEDKKPLNAKILSNDEYNVSEIIKEFEPLILKIISNIVLILKNSSHIKKTNNYILYNYSNNKSIENEIPIMILLGGSSYKMYSLFYNKYFNEDIIDLNDYLINSIDYDFSILVYEKFDKTIFMSILKDIVVNNMNLMKEINDNNKLQSINKNDIKNDIFLRNKKRINLIEDENKLNNIIFTYSDSGSDYFSIQLSIKFNNKIYQIIELLFWRNEIISNLIYLKDFEINKSIFFQTNDFKIILPDIEMLLKTNMYSMKIRLQNKDFNKCKKDFYRLKFIELLNNFPNKEELKNNIKDENIKKSIEKIVKIYKKDNPYIFKLPYSICSLEDNTEQELFYDLYDKFLNLNTNEQFKILNNNLK